MPQSAIPRAENSIENERIDPLNKSVELKRSTTFPKLPAKGVYGEKGDGEARKKSLRGVEKTIRKFYSFHEIDLLMRSHTNKAGDKSLGLCNDSEDRSDGKVAPFGKKAKGLMSKQSSFFGLTTSNNQIVLTEHSLTKPSVPPTTKNSNAGVNWKKTRMRFLLLFLASFYQFSR